MGTCDTFPTLKNQQMNWSVWIDLLLIFWLLTEKWFQYKFEFEFWWLQRNKVKFFNNFEILLMTRHQLKPQLDKIHNFRDVSWNNSPRETTELLMLEKWLFLENLSYFLSFLFSLYLGFEGPKNRPLLKCKTWPSGSEIKE
jgi:hypothetical protein